jgi:hypothetical protein
VTTSRVSLDRATGTPQRGHARALLSRVLAWRLPGAGLVPSAGGGQARILRSALAYASAAILASAAAVVFLELWRADFHVPFLYGGDELLHALVVKSVLDHGWYLTNPNLGAPAGLQLYDYPVCADDTVHLLAIKALGLFSTDWAFVQNLYFLLGFPLIALSAMAVFRRLGAGHVPSIVGAVLYSFLPSRLLNGEAHLFLDVFYQVPLAILVMLWVCGAEPPLVEAGRRPGSIRFGVRSRRSKAAIALCLFCGSSSLYYSFFTACLLVAGGLWASFDRRSIRQALSGVTLAALLGATVAANGLPTIAYEIRHGVNDAAALRAPREADVYGMRMAQLLLPVDDHRVPALARLKRWYAAGRAFPVETTTTSLGLVGSVGFLTLLGLLLAGRRRDGPDGDPLRPIAVLNAIAVLLATVGGFGSLFALLVTARIRSYARINVLIGFFALVPVVLGLHRARASHPRLATFAALAILVVGLLDQVAPTAVPPYEPEQRTYAGEADIVHRIEATVGPDAMIFELPYMGFPEAPPIARLGNYDLIRPYLHSRTLRWSFPAMHGRASDLWAITLSKLDPASLLDAVRAIGSKGILVDRAGYAEAPPSIETALRGLVGAPPMVSRDGRLAFFDVSHVSRVASLDARSLSPEERERRIEVASHPLVFGWTDGCYDVELVKDDGTAFRWCRGSGVIGVQNELPYPRRVTLRATLFPASTPARIAFDSAWFGAEFDLAAAGTALEREVDVPPGYHEIRFRADGQAADVPADPRTLVWRIQDFSFDEAAARFW